MASKVHKKGTVSPEMNMTPLIDVTFQLIIFFMLVNNIIAEEAVELVPPKLTEPQTQELGEVEKVTINIVPPSDLEGVKGLKGVSDLRTAPPAAQGVRVGVTDFPMEELESATDLLRGYVEKSGKLPDGSVKLEVLLRADARFPFSDIQPVMAAITSAGIERIKLVAYLPDEGPTAMDDWR